MKKLLTTLLVLMLALCALGLVACGDNPNNGQKNDITDSTIGLAYRLSDDGTYYICTGIGMATGENIIIGSKYNNLPIKEIDKEAFKVCSIKSIVIGDNVTNINDAAFFCCENLKTVIFGENSKLENISYAAFNGCGSLESIVIPESVTIIGAQAFGGTSLKNITFEENSKLEKIDSGAFSLCFSLESIKIPSSVTIVGNQAFSDCGIKNIEMPSGLMTIGDYAFFSCFNLKTVTFESACKLESIGEGAFSGCSSLESIDIPSSLINMGDYAFYNCDILEYNEYDNALYLGNSENKYVALMKAKNSEITSCEINLSTKILSARAFGECNSLINIEIPASIVSIGKNIFSYCNNLESVVVESGNTIYHSENKCIIETASKTLILGLKNSVIPTDGSVTSIGVSAFENCAQLTNVTIPNGVTNIGEKAFYGCYNLENIEIPNSIVNIGSGAFEGCHNLQYNEDNNVRYLGNSINKCIVAMGVTNNEIASLDINSNTKIIYDSAFMWCSNIESIEIPSSVASIGSVAFRACGSLKTITFKENSALKSIGSGAFNSCVCLESIEIPASVINIGDSAFYNCSGLKTILFEENSALENIGYETFRGCSSLESITISNSVKSIGEMAFFDCSNLKSIMIPKSVTSIGYGAFYNCSDSLESIVVESGNTMYHSEGNCLIETKNKILVLGCKNSVIPTNGSVTSIADNAFIWCSDLESIVIPSKVTRIGAYAFYYCSSLQSITIPTSVTYIDFQAFESCSKLTNIYYNGTIQQWNIITKGYSWDNITGDYTIHCTDGDIAK